MKKVSDIVKIGRRVSKILRRIHKCKRNCQWVEAINAIHLSANSFKQTFSLDS